MFQDILSEIDGTEKQDSGSGFGIKLGHELAVFSQQVGEITDVPEVTTTTRNSLGYRCDEFDLNATGMKIVFSGCSTTYGSGLGINDTWAKMVYDDLKQDYDLGPYVNIARPASSAFNIISETYKYIYKYGTPDIIALSFPSIFRGYKVEEYSNHQINIYNSHLMEYFNKPIEELRPIANALLPYLSDYLVGLMLFCRTNNIKLYMFVWEGELPELPTYRALPFYGEAFVDFGDIDREIYSQRHKFKNEMFANDNAHLGVVFHYHFANRIAKKIREDLEH